MTEFVDIDFAPLSGPAAPSTAAAGERGALVVFVGGDLKLGSQAAKLAERAAGLIEATAPVAKFKGKVRTAMDILAPAGLDYDRLVVIGTDA